MRPGVKAPALAALGCAAGLVLLLVVAFAIAPFPRFDALALKGFEALQGPLATPILTAIAHTADPLPLAIFLAVLGAVGFVNDRRRQLAAAALAVVGANVATQILKIVLAHPRFHTLLPEQLSSATFPSGHATAAMSMALAAIIVATPRRRPVVALAGCAYVISVVLAILVLAWHYPSDALGGLLVAAGFAFAAVAASRFVARRHADATSLAALAAFLPSKRAWAAVAAAGLGVALARADDLVSFAVAHTSTVAFLGFVAAACLVLTLSASLLADR